VKNASLNSSTVTIHRIRQRESVAIVGVSRCG
jgi:hypothetical protein